MSKEILKVGDWIQYIAINGQSQHGKVDNLVEDMNIKEIRVDLKLLNGQTDYIWMTDDWIKAHPNGASLLDEKYNERNKQSNDVQQRKRNKKIVQWSDGTKLKFIERVIQDLSPLAAYHIGNAIDVLAVAESEDDIEQARWSIQRAYENWD
ncbi:hypothetical protein NGC65_00215 [Staphylococcus xylosus]|uniref:hypothetical protein n=1 Tax=Staphylococcus xylosus TaxID=1288 RepID=UPI002DBF6E6B|nr:hypothetical protein [Staphylococcus xylosus]MEB7863865.1 hypothetical protein [Staphylococcus xylosus]